MADSEGTDWIKLIIGGGLLTTVGAILSKLYDSWIARSQHQTTVDVEKIRSDQSSKVEMRKLSIEEDKLLFAEYRSYVDSLKARTSALETKGEDKDKRITALESQHKDCVDQHEECKEEVTQLKGRVEDLEKRSGSVR